MTKERALTSRKSARGKLEPIDGVHLHGEQDIHPSGCEDCDADERLRRISVCDTGKVDIKSVGGMGLRR
jgi:hypothetical protein